MKGHPWWWSCLKYCLSVPACLGGGWWVWNLVRLLVAGGVGTLLGPEGSGEVVLSESLWASFVLLRVCVGWGLVGLLFEICIVDASIFHAGRRSVSLLGGRVGVSCG